MSGAEPFIIFAGLKLARMIASRGIDYATLEMFKREYDRLPDKRRRPGPKLRKVIHLLESGHASEAREELKESAYEMVDSGMYELVEAGRKILDMLAYM